MFNIEPKYKESIMVKVSLLIGAMLMMIFTGCSDAIKEISTTISGNVSSGGEPVSGAYVILLDAGDSVTSGLSLSNGMITNSNGDYTMVEVSAGDHYVAAIDDANGNIIFDPDTDRLGYYGDPDTNTGVTIPRTLHTNDGDDLKNIDITRLYRLQ